MYFTDKQQHAIPLFLKSNFLPIEMIYFEKTASLMYDISTNEAPSLIQQLLQGQEMCMRMAQDWPPEEIITLNPPDLKFKKLVFAFWLLCLEQLTSKITSCQ